MTNSIKLIGAATIGLMGAAMVQAQDASPTEGPVDVVQVEGGLVQGIETDVAGVQVFKGIPYAGPTGGENRFRPPQPVEPWEGVKLADTWGDQTLQDPGIFQEGTFWYREFYWDADFIPPVSENGLVLNVFTPAGSADDNLPVYVWNHGGAHDHGNASEMEFWATKLAEKGVVVVSVQYRLGPVAHLTLAGLTEESGIGSSGNLAILDLIDALEWVRDNIAGFGGDPSRVTVGGQSAGAGNVVALLRSPLSKGLMHRAVIESTGGGILPDSDILPIAEREAQDAAALEEIFGKPMSVADLRAITQEEYLSRDADGKLLHDKLNGAIARDWVLDGHVFTEESVDLLRPGALDGIDILIGATSDERTSTVGDPTGTLSAEDFAAKMDATYGEAWKGVYEWDDPMQGYRLRLRSEADYRLQGALVSAEYAAAHNEGGNVYAYWFNHAPPGHDDAFYGSYHSSDLWYFFNSIRDDFPGQRPWTEADHRMAETMSGYLANFVANGDPNGEGLPQWPQPEGGTAFVRFADGYAYPVETTPWPKRDALNRATMLGNLGMEPADLSN